MKDLDSTIIQVRRRISEDPDPFLVEVLRKLETVRSNQQVMLEEKAARKYRGGFKGYGVT